MSTVQSAPKPFQIAAAMIGNALEWYDFLVFGFFTVIISRLFFPAGSQYASLLLTTATFGVGFFMRPVGGILLGIYADRSGRKAALLLVIALMTVAIALIAFAPTYAAIGIFATWLIQATGTPIAPAFYLMLGAVVGLLTALFLTERAGDAQLVVSDIVEARAA
jgi:MFS transporter, MHS family, proline/betaine transporter